MSRGSSRVSRSALPVAPGPQGPGDHSYFKEPGRLHRAGAIPRCCVAPGDYVPRAFFLPTVTSLAIRSASTGGHGIGSIQSRADLVDERFSRQTARPVAIAAIPSRTLPEWIAAPTFPSTAARNDDMAQ